MTPKFISLLIISSICAILILFGLKWFNDSKEASKREAVAILEGKYSELLKQDSILQLTIKSQQTSIDSSKLIISKSLHDTIKIYNTMYVNLNKVKQLSIDSSIAFLANRLK